VGAGGGCCRRGIDTSEKLGRHRWVVERTLARLTNGYRHLRARCERHAHNHLGFATLAAALTRFERLPT
jgi:transposase